MDGGQCGSDDEKDEESSSNNFDNEVEELRKRWNEELDLDDLKDELTGFRKRWREELNHNESRKDSSEDHQKNKLNQAIGFYHLGEKAEQSGQMYEAIQLYRKAEHLEPDVESHLREAFSSIANEEELSEENCNSEDSDDEEINDNTDLVSYFFKRQKKMNKFCLPLCPTQTTHISDLPQEVIEYILRWVVSSDLDLRSLEQCGMVCLGFYLYARNRLLWKAACQRVWDDVSLNSLYSSWRQMWILKPRVRFNGVYINKTSYVRHGDTSFQDCNYRPWHTVTYYRYLRFFPEGKFLTVTTAEEPFNVIPHMKFCACNMNRFAVGNYCMDENIIQAEFQGTSIIRRNSVPIRAVHGFYIELEVKAHRNKPHSVLKWRKYVHKSSHHMTDFDLNPLHFPPFWFSRVKSYTKEAVEPV